MIARVLGVIDMDRNQLVVFPLVVTHAHDANGPGPQKDSRCNLSLAQDQNIEWIVVGAVGPWDKAIVRRIVNRAIKNAIDPKQAGCLIQFVLDLRSSRYL